MIKSWTDRDGLTHWADENSKAYENRDEADTKTAKSAPKPIVVEIAKSDPAK